MLKSIKVDLVQVSLFGYILLYMYYTFTLLSFMLELATIPSEKFEKLRPIFNSNDAW